ncbi:MAG: peroxiredoxin family protein [Bacteroides sp.]|nr:peroxiredoxin family protein [Bacteroides sp.]
MKKQILFAVIAVLYSCAPGNKVVLEGEVTGLLPGDTLILQEYELPDWKEIQADTFYISSPGQFSIQKELSHTTYFLLEHLPKGRPAVITCMRGASFVAKPGDRLTFRGSEDLWGALSKSGGFYQDTLIAQTDSLETNRNREQIEIYRNMHRYRTDGFPDSVRKYSDLYRAPVPVELEEKRRYLKDSVNNSEYAAFSYLYSLYDVTYSQLEDRLARFDPRVRASYMGQQLERMLAILKNIEVGHTPADFTVTDIEGETIRLSDYRGKYTLIYHWGLCPGIIWVHPRLLTLYEHFHDKGFEVIGFTPDNFFETYESYKDDTEIGPLFNQPWKTVFTDWPENEFITESYYFSGVPILMLISPEGVTLERGYSEVYQKLKKILEENLGKIE